MDVTTAELRELALCHTMGLNRSGTLGLVAGRTMMGIVNLDKPDTLLQKVPRIAKYDIGEIQFSLGCETLSAVACNNKIELLDWRPDGSMVCLKVMSRKNYAVTDISFHEQNTNLLVSASYDTHVYVWDIREKRLPVIELPSLVGTSQACWERMTGQNLATAHNGEIKIWDIRKADIPQQYINAHPRRIYCLDFSPIKENQLLSCSMDSTIKMWDVTGPTRQPVKMFREMNGNAALRVRYTPFGDGLVSIIHHNVVNREKNNLLLWSARNTRMPVHTFYGHMDLVQEFAWRKPSTERPDYQLVTWGKDALLKVWPIGGHLKVMCGEEDDGVASEEARPRPKTLAFDTAAASTLDNTTSILKIDQAMAASPTLTRASSGSPSEASADPVLAKPNELMRELSQVDFGDTVYLQKMDLNQRTLVVQTETVSRFILFEIRFPYDYPRAQPQFEFNSQTTLDQEAGFAIIKKMRALAQARAGETCLEPCLRLLEHEIRLIKAEEEAELAKMLEFKKNNSPTFIQRYYKDTRIPYPKISGARFCGLGQLVCFGWTYTVVVPKVDAAIDENMSRAAIKTPRAMAALSGAEPTSSGDGKKSNGDAKTARNGSTANSTAVGSQASKNGRKFDVSADSIDRNSTSSSSGRLMPSDVKPTVTNYNVLPLLHIDKKLAERYIMRGKGVVAMCKHNAVAAYQLGYKDIAHAWVLVSRMCSILLEGVESGGQGGCELRHNKGVLLCSCPQPQSTLGDTSSTTKSFNPLGQLMLKKVVGSFVRQKDLQTAATMLCVFSQAVPRPRNVEKRFGELLSLRHEVKGRQPALTKSASDIGTNLKKSANLLGLDEATEAISAPPSNHLSARLMNRVRSNSESLSKEEFASRLSAWYGGARTASEGAAAEAKAESEGSEEARPDSPASCESAPAAGELGAGELSAGEVNAGEVDDNGPIFVEGETATKRAYADVLAKMGLFAKAASVFKTIRDDATDGQLFAVGVHCGRCKTVPGDDRVYEKYCVMNGNVCFRCRRQNDFCSVCELPVRGLSTTCFACGHGGHLAHVDTWFRTYDRKCCPRLGCGCECQAAMSRYWDHMYKVPPYRQKRDEERRKASVKQYVFGANDEC